MALYKMGTKSFRSELLHLDLERCETFGSDDHVVIEREVIDSQVLAGFDGVRGNVPGPFFPVEGDREQHFGGHFE